MTEPPRIHGPGGPADLPGAKKDRTVGADDFKKFMVEEVKDIDPHQKRHRKRREEIEEESEEVKKITRAPVSSKTSSIEKMGAPASKKPGTAQQIPTSTTPLSSKTPPSPEFNIESIEEFAWEEEASAPPSASPAEQPPSRKMAVKPPSEETMMISSQAAATEEPSISSEQWSEEAPPSSSHYPSERPEPRREEYPTRKESPPISRKEEPEPQPAAKPEKRKEIEAPSAAQKKARKPVPAKETPAKAAPPSQPPEKPTSAEELAALEEDETAKAPRKKGKVGPMLAQEEARSKLSQADFKKFMEEEAQALKEKLPGEEVPQAPEAALTKGKKALVGGELAPEIPSPTKEPAPAKALPIAAPGTRPTDLSSTKKGLTDKIPSAKAREQEELIEAGEEGLAIPAVPQAAESGQGEPGKEKRRQRPGKEVAEPAAGAIPITTPPSSAAVPTEITAPPALTSTSPYAVLHPEILDLFERLVGVMTVMQTAGISETTMTLSEKAFANSQLFGATITIRTYDIARNEMHLEFSGSSQALALMQQNLPSLLAAFQAGNYNFIIKRFEFRIGGVERPIFSRKDELRERSGDEQQRNQEERDSS